MKIILRIILYTLFSDVSASAQFYTVLRHENRFCIATTTDAPTDENNEKLHKPIPPSGVTDTAGKKKEWIDRYLSVSYPLRNMVITSVYGKRKDPFTDKTSWHSGIDLKAAFGEEVYAMMAGQIIKTGYDKRSGKYLTVRHGDFTITYCHLSDILVSSGSPVAPGQPVASAGSSGRATGPHLHITARLRNRKISPEILFDYVRRIREEAVCNLRKSNLN